MIALDDRGLLLGDGLFETLLAWNGRLILFDEHLQRMAKGADELGLPRPDAETARQLALQAVAQPGLGGARAAVRITYTAGSGGRGLDRPDELGPRLFAAASFAPAIETPAALSTSPIRRNPTSPASRLKSLAYLDNVQARRLARSSGADEALMLDVSGNVASAAAANLFWIEGDALFTAPDLGAILPGIMRGKVLEAATALGIEAIEVLAPAARLASASAMFVTSSLIGVRRVFALDGRAYGDHPLIGRLVAAVSAWR